MMERLMSFFLQGLDMKTMCKDVLSSAEFLRKLCSKSSCHV